tara:strand:- start:1697 stop:2116 length:420 start_codon:yes stop_codon:yes gene_type:complete
MATPLKHAESSAKKWGGKAEEYLDIHTKMDCSKKYFPDNRHRMLTHNMFFIFEVIIPIYGAYFTNSIGKSVSTKDVCELHILEDYHMRYIPTPQDWLENLQLKSWMQNGMGEVPSSVKLNYPNGISKQKMRTVKFRIED